MDQTMPDDLKTIVKQVMRASDIGLDLAEIYCDKDQLDARERVMWMKLGPTTKPPKPGEWPMLCRCKSCGKRAPHGTYQLRNNYIDENGEDVFAFRTRHYWCPECKARRQR